MAIHTFPKGKPEDFSVSSGAVRETIRSIREENNLELHSFLLLRRGSLLWEEYFREGERERLHVMHSVSKSFTSLAIGMAQEQGLLSVEDKLYDFFPEHASLRDSDWKREVTLKHLLMMGSGFENREQEILGNMFSYNYAEQALALPIIHKPGTVFNYYTLGTYLLSAAFSKVNPLGVHGYLRRKLMDPMGFGPSQWNVDLNNIPAGGFGLYLRARDMARFGQLCLQKGLWEGQRLAPEGFILEASSKQIRNDDINNPDNPDNKRDWAAGYGYQFWRCQMGGYRADGMHGQYIIILPEKDLVVVMTSNLDNMQIPLTAVSTLLLPGVSGL